MRTVIRLVSRKRWTFHGTYTEYYVIKLIAYLPHHNLFRLTVLSGVLAAKFQAQTLHVQSVVYTVRERFLHRRCWLGQVHDVDVNAQLTHPAAVRANRVRTVVPLATGGRVVQLCDRCPAGCAALRGPTITDCEEDEMNGCEQCAKSISMQLGCVDLFTWIRDTHIGHDRLIRLRPARPKTSTPRRKVVNDASLSRAE